MQGHCTVGITGAADWRQTGLGSYGEGDCVAVEGVGRRGGCWLGSVVQAAAGGCGRGPQESAPRVDGDSPGRLRWVGEGKGLRVDFKNTFPVPPTSWKYGPHRIVRVGWSGLNSIW